MIERFKYIKIYFMNMTHDTDVNIEYVSNRTMFVIYSGLLANAQRYKNLDDVKRYSEIALNAGNRVIELSDCVIAPAIEDLQRDLVIVRAIHDRVHQQ